MMRASRGHRADTVIVLIIFCIFAVSVLLVLALSASIYRNMTEISREGYDERTALAYVWTMVKNSDREGSIGVDSFHGQSALVIDEQINDTQYRTRIYMYDGRLYVLFSDAGLEFLPRDGVSVFEIEELNFDQLESGLIIVSAGAHRLMISPRGASGAPFEGRAAG